MPSQKSRAQVLEALHTIPEAHQNFSGIQEICANIKNCFQLLILRQLSGRMQACQRRNTQYGVNLPSCCWDGPGTKAEYKSKLMKPREVATERAEQEPRITRTRQGAGRSQMHSYSSRLVEQFRATKEIPLRTWLVGPNISQIQTCWGD